MIVRICSWDCVGTQSKAYSFTFLTDQWPLGLERGGRPPCIKTMSYNLMELEFISHILIIVLDWNTNVVVERIEPMKSVISASLFSYITQENEGPI